MFFNNILPATFVLTRNTVWVVSLYLSLAFTSASAASVDAGKVSQWQQISPALVFGGFLINLALFAGWVIYAGLQRRKVREQDLRLTEEVARQTKALSEALQYAELKHRQQTQIVSYISHDLRAPLATIAGYAKLMKRSINNDDKNRLKLQAITRSVECQLDLIEYIQGYAAAELNPIDEASEAISLTVFLDEIAQYATTLGRSQNNNFHIKVTQRIPKTVYIDCLRVRQVLLNLLSNAAKSIRNGDIYLELTATEFESHWRLHFSVSDSGIGINPEQQAKIAQGFDQLKEGNKGVNAGLGLGLYMAQSILQKMGIELNLDSNPDLGARFSFGLKVLTDEQVVDWTPPQTVPLDTTELPLSHELNAPAQTGAQPANYAGLESMPSLASRQELASMARNGLLTEMEDWHSSMLAQYGYCVEYLSKIQDAISRLDLHAVEQLALNPSIPHRP